MKKIVMGVIEWGHPIIEIDVGGGGGLAISIFSILLCVFFKWVVYFGTACIYMEHSIRKIHFILENTEFSCQLFVVQ